MTDLQLVNGCPSWCVEDHTNEPPEDWGHGGEEWELRLPDGRLMMDARVTLEPGEALPTLVVGGSLNAMLDDVLVLDVEGARQFENALQSFTQRVQRAQRLLRGRSVHPGKSGRRFGESKDARMGWRETRLYLAERDGRRCFYCRTEFDGLKGVTIDHYVPYSLMQCNMPANLVLSCQACNERKGAQLTWSMAAVLLAWQREQPVTVPDRHTVTGTPCRTGTGPVTRDGHGTAGREAPAAGEQPLLAPAVAACS
ncbi:HNH endonuclease [Streptomyces sp. NBC_00481]|uniref:HNH endonuclease n=1 Tax=Streptomyces sp. NBC_00481 TaxID=2975755 RepID=UPI002DDA8259|nr:HNH endonuclease [Streptomyces sp. NBC_00481]WRY99043.1 HNH endonuclease [Streptomyces sp. NBC_00481]